VGETMFILSLLTHVVIILPITLTGYGLARFVLVFILLGQIDQIVLASIVALVCLVSGAIALQEPPVING
jgi:hypothetical protein